LSVRYQLHTWAAFFSRKEPRVSIVWEADGPQNQSGRCGRKENLPVIDAVNFGLASLETYCMCGPPALDTRCLSFSKRFSMFCLRHRHCHLRKLRLSSYRVWSVYDVQQGFLCRFSLCCCTYMHLYCVCSTQLCSHFPYSHAALLYFIIHWCSVLLLLLSLPPPLSVVPTWFPCQPCYVLDVMLFSAIFYSRSSSDDVV